jgi:hypothetical protein
MGKNEPSTATTDQGLARARVLSSTCSDFAAAVNGVRTRSHRSSRRSARPSWTVYRRRPPCWGAWRGPCAVVQARPRDADYAGHAPRRARLLLMSLCTTTRASSPSSRPRNTLSPASAHSGSPSWPAASHPDTSSSRTTP